MKRADLEKSLTTVQASYERINRTLGDLAQREKSLQDTVNRELVADGESKNLAELTNVKARIEALQGALAFAGTELEKARRELEDFKNAELVTQQNAIDDRCKTLVGEIQETIGENGLNGKLAQMRGLLDEMNRVSSASKTQDVQIHENYYIHLWAGLGGELMKYWKEIEGLPYITKPPRAAERAGFIPGFGRLPHSIG